VREKVLIPLGTCQGCGSELMMQDGKIAPHEDLDGLPEPGKCVGSYQPPMERDGDVTAAAVVLLKAFAGSQEALARRWKSGEGTPYYFYEQRKGGERVKIATHAADLNDLERARQNVEFAAVARKAARNARAAARRLAQLRLARAGKRPHRAKLPAEGDRVRYGGKLGCVAAVEAAGPTSFDVKVLWSDGRESSMIDWPLQRLEFVH
jgi:hypothetical protein